jgi:type I restriction enzyme S subunit
MSELYTLPDGWEWKKLDDFVSIKGGKRIPKGKKLLETKTNYPYIRVTDFNDFGSIDLNNIQYITEEIYNEIKNYIISKDDIYISIAGTIGKTGIIPNELDGANLTENAAKLVFDNSKYDKYFLLYFTNSIPFLEQIGLATKTVAMPKLALTRLKEVEIPLPPLEEQKRIVAKLDNLFAKIDKAIALHQKNIDEANVFMASVLNDVFVELEEKYNKEKFDEIKTSNVIGLVRSVKEQSPSLQYQYVKMNNITNNNRFTFDNIINVDATDEEIRKFNLEKGDFLFNTRNSAELVGKSCIFDYDMKNILYNNNIMRVRFRDDISSYFVSYQFGCNYLKEQLENIKSATTNVAAINVTKIFFNWFKNSKPESCI